ncbi:Proline/betaine transporter [Aquicella siphonis]|uniref:Proline/betaine transporter n=1 Tax=Aquicella siphonis TaxID=254247 RepID=A0A5E4PFI8_9COXI|nr:MFS transporter [Aquicella siphonis]VVC75750.1 Proline/betaine transporter [Aquicella siphonis]
MPDTRTITPRQRRMLILSSLGGVLEFYDFIIYIFLAPVIEKLFFAESSNYMATLKTLAIFSIGYLLRPLGGIIFSHFGDRYGRKVVFLMTVIFMAIPSFAIGLLPTPREIGIAAPLLLLLLRMMQGLALGGEIPAAITFVSEHVPGRRRAFALSVLFFGINMGLLLGSLVTTLLTSLLTEAEIFAYGYRIPFLLGGFFGMFSLFLRRHLHETTAFTSLRQMDLQRVPLLTLMRHSYPQVLQGMLLVGTGSVTVFLYLYWPQYLHQYMNYDFAGLMRINTAGTLVLNLTILLGGVLADKWGYRNLYLMGTTLLVLLTFPLFMLFNQHNLTWVIMSYMLFSLLFGFIPGSYSAILSGLFPTSVRYSGIAMSYNLAFAVFGGLSPVICTFAIHTFNSVLAPAYYVMLMAMLSWIACYLGKKSEEQQPKIINRQNESAALAMAEETGR